MSEIPNDLKYTDTHEWIHEDEDGVCSIGITDHAQSLLGDLVYIELPRINSYVKQGDDICIVESVKAAVDVYAPLSGEIVAVNDLITDSAAIVNSDPYDSGWLFQIKPTNTEELEDLLLHDAYEKLIEEE